MTRRASSVVLFVGIIFVGLGLYFLGFAKGYDVGFDDGRLYEFLNLNRQPTREVPKDKVLVHGEGKWQSSTLNTMKKKMSCQSTA